MTGKMEDSAGFDMEGFLLKLSMSRNNLERCDRVRSEIDALAERYGVSDLVEIRTSPLSSIMIQDGVYNIEVSMPDLRRPRKDGLDELVMSCHTDAIKLSLFRPVSPGVNDNGSGTAVLMSNMEEGLRCLSSRKDTGGSGEIEDAPRTRYLFFSGEEGSVKGLTLSMLMVGMSYAPVGLLGNVNLPGNYVGPLSTICSLGMLETLAHSAWFSNGLCGSFSWAKALPKEDIKREKTFVNFDMVGQYGLSNEGGIKGFLQEASRRRKQKRASLEGTITEDGDTSLKSVVVPSSNISTNPVSWVMPVKHGLSKYVGEMVYAASVERGELYNVRDYLALGSSDHASVQQVSNWRKGKIESAMIIGLGGMERRHQIHTSRDLSVDESDLEFSRRLSEMLARNNGYDWKNYSQVRHLDDLRYLGFFSEGKSRIAAARCYDEKRDMWVNLYFDAATAEKRRDGLEEEIMLGEDNFLDWDLSNDIYDRKGLKAFEGYSRVKHDGKVLFKERSYSMSETSAFRRIACEYGADISGFFSDRMVLAMMGTIIPLDYLLTAAGGKLADAVENPLAAMGVLVGTLGVILWGSVKAMMLPLNYSNVIAETVYDIEARRANSQLYKAVPSN